jgi:IS605 OrfB family transposase
MPQFKEAAEAAAAEKDKRHRAELRRIISAEATRVVIAKGVAAGLAEPVVQGVARDVCGGISGYIELRAGGHPAEWPEPGLPYTSDLSGSLDLLASSSTEDQEATASSALHRISRGPTARPFTLARARDGLIVRDAPNGRMAAILNVLRATKDCARVTTIKAGINATTGEMLAAGRSKAKIAIPLRCGKWHEGKFLSGNARLCASQIIRRGARWFMAGQFEMVTKDCALTGARIGVDRGIVNPVAMAVVQPSGAVAAVIPPMGAEIGKAIKAAEKKRRAEEKRRGTTSHRHAKRVGDGLHRLANAIVTEAKSRGARVVVEQLGGLKETIVAARPKGSRKGGWRHGLKRAQLGKLETILAYKLALAGLPKMQEVVAGGTSQTCLACGVRDPKNRVTQARFACVGCGFDAHADTVGAVNIARRSVAMEKIAKGAKLAPLERNMVLRLRSRNDNGLGPLVRDYACVNGFVAGRASAETDAPHLGLTVSVGQNDISCAQNGFMFVFPEGGVAFEGPERAPLETKPDG